MSKNSKRRKEAIENSLEAMDAEQRKFEQNRAKDQLEDKKEIARPSLLKRIGAGLLDFVFAGLLAAGFFAIAYFGIFPSVGYQESTQRIISFHDESWLFVNVSGKYEELTKHYDEAKSPEENYDVPIMHFYKTSTYAIKSNEYEAYSNRKLASNYYILDENDNIVRKEDVAPVDVKAFLIEEYERAVSFFYDDPQLVYDYSLTYKAMIIAIFSVVTIGSLVFYFVVPLIDKRHRTFGYMITGLIPVNSGDLSDISWKQTLLRSFIFVIITYISPITMYVLFKGITFSFIPFFINTAILSFSHSNSGLHDYAAKVNVINKSHSNPFETLKNITGGDENR